VITDGEIETTTAQSLQPSGSDDPADRWHDHDGAGGSEEK
jgi:hypothetical protein